MPLPRRNPDGEPAENGTSQKRREPRMSASMFHLDFARTVAPDAPDDWTETAKIPDYEYSTKKVPMNLHFPAE